MKFSAGDVKTDYACPVCSQEMRSVAQLTQYPLTELYEPYSEGAFESRALVDQALLYCKTCGHAKLGTIISPEFLYSHYRTTTSHSAGAVAAIKKFHAFVAEYVKVADFATVVDVGANDASLLNCFRGTARRLVAIDPNVGKHVSAGSGIEIVNMFVEAADLSSLKSGENLVLCSHTLEHIEHPENVLAKLHASLGQNDICAFQFPSLELLVRDARFDQVNHQHMHYFSERSTRLLLRRLGFEVLRVEFDSDHYGSLMVLFRKTRSAALEDVAVPALGIDRILAAQEVFELNMKASDLRVRSGAKDLVAYGAALMLPILVYYMPSLERVKCIVDDDKSKEGLRYVNFNKRIVHSAGFSYEGKDVVVTAVSTKLALRRVTEKLFGLGVDNIIIPLNQI